MAQKISGLTAKGATIADTDLVEVSQSAGGGAYVSRSVTGANIKALVTDANMTTSDITTNNVSTSKHGFAPKAPNDTTKFLRGDGTWAVPAAGSSSGKFGISDSTGAYTFYSSLSSAITAASSGQVIELFADITESSSTAVDLKAGVIIQGNGHTYTHTSTTGNTFVCPTAGTYQFMNLNINRTVTTPTGAAIFAGKSGAFYHVYTLVFNATTVQYNYTSSVGATVFVDPISVHSFIIDGLRAIANGSGTMIPSSARVTNMRNSYLENTGTGSGFASENFSPSYASLENCYIKTNSGTSFVLSYSAQARNCTGISVSGKAFEGGVAYDSYGFSNTSIAFDAASAFNCTAQTTTGICFNGSGLIIFNCTGQSTTGYVIRPFFNMSKYYNCSLYSSGSIVAFDSDYGASFYNCSIISDYNNASGHAISIGPSSGNPQFINNYIQVGNASANCLKGSSAITAKYTNNNFSGATTSVNANVTQGTSNSEDSQGNITI